MLTTPEHPITREAFLAWEAQQERRYEFDGVNIVTRPDPTMAHATIRTNLTMALGTRLRGGRCRCFGGSLKVATPDGYRYPDGFVVCTPGSNASTFVTDPVVVIEVGGPGTNGVDTVARSQDYLAIPSVKQYVVLAQDRIHATVFQPATKEWVGHVLAGDTILPLPEIGIELPLLELYEQLSLHPNWA